MTCPLCGCPVTAGLPDDAIGDDRQGGRGARSEGQKGWVSRRLTFRPGPSVMFL
jgi:hypothetical protein